MPGDVRSLIGPRSCTWSSSPELAACTTAACAQVPASEISSAHGSAGATSVTMCAGVTVWEPLRRWQAGPGKRVAVVGLGGLGHLAVKFAHALGAEVTVFTASASKVAAATVLGADHVVLSTDGAAMAAAAYRFDLFLDTASRPRPGAVPTVCGPGRHAVLAGLPGPGHDRDDEPADRRKSLAALDRLSRNDVRYRSSLDMSVL